jgi:8-oxo-dGTP diphosphatase
MHPFYQLNFSLCPRCGSRFAEVEDHLHCSKCDFRIYPHPSPATAVFIFRKEGEQKQVLLGKRAFEPYKGYWDSLGGFVKPDESIEQGAIREVEEEATVEVEVEQIIGSYPDEYQRTPTITVGLIAKIVSGNLAANDDVGQLKWFSVNDLPNKIAFESVRILLAKAIANY